jgi:catechol 1,2-dioxygenase
MPNADASSVLVATETAEHKTTHDVLGPFYKRGSPFRAKISPPLAAGSVLIISGHVRGLPTGSPIPNAVLDVWQADATGVYSVPTAGPPSDPLSFTNRARLTTDEQGYYEFETVYPGPYKMDDGVWRSPHIHFRVEASNFAPLTTQLFFEAAVNLGTDPYMKPSLIIPLTYATGPGSRFQRGTFDIILK